MKLFWVQNTNIWTGRYVIAKSEESAQKIALTRITVKDIRNLTVEEKICHNYSNSNIKQITEEGFAGVIDYNHDTEFQTWKVGNFL